MGQKKSKGEEAENKKIARTIPPPKTKTKHNKKGGIWTDRLRISWVQATWRSGVIAQNWIRSPVALDNGLPFEFRGMKRAPFASASLTKLEPPALWKWWYLDTGAKVSIMTERCPVGGSGEAKAEEVAKERVEVLAEVCWGATRNSRRVRTKADKPRSGSTRGRSQEAAHEGRALTTWSCCSGQGIGPSRRRASPGRRGGGHGEQCTAPPGP